MPDDPIVDPVDLGTPPVDPPEPVDPDTPIEPVEPVEPEGFNKTQLQQIGSALGRIVKNQMEEFTPPQPQGEVPHPTDAVEKFSQDIQEEIFTNPVSAIRKVMNVIKGAETNLSNTHKVATDKAITAFSEDPDYKDCFTNAQKIAHNAVKEGMPPVAAARLGFYEAKATHLEPKKEVTDLGMLKSGKQTKIEKQPKLPAQFKKQAAKDIADGHYKDEAEWIASLSPKIRADYNF